MQTEPGNFRFRGWRESRRLVESAHSVPADLKKVYYQADLNEVNFQNLTDALDTLSDFYISHICRLRVQYRYRQKNKS